MSLYCILFRIIPGHATYFLHIFWKYFAVRPSHTGYASEKIPPFDVVGRGNEELALFSVLAGKHRDAWIEDVCNCLSAARQAKMKLCFVMIMIPLLEAFVQSALASHFRLHILLFLPAMHLNMPSQHWQREWVPFTDLGGRGASLKDTSSRHTM